MESWEAPMRGHARRATLRDIAQDVGVSTGTVSVVLNGARSGTSVADRTREAIHASARRLGYRPNWVAKSLQGGATRTVGIIPTEAGRDFLLGPHIQRVLNATANVLHERHHDLLVITRCDQSDGRGILEAVVNGRVDGAIVVAPHIGSRLVETLAEANFPLRGARRRSRRARGDVQRGRRGGRVARGRAPAYPRA